MADRLATLLVGIDAACEAVLDPLVEAGELPTLRRLFADGAAGELESQVPPWTASAWPSLYTGTNPGKHGVFDFLHFEGYDHDVVDATSVRQPSLWELLDRRGLSSVVVNVPVTHPPRAFDGALVPGYTAPEDPPCHPEGLLAELRDAVGEYRVYPAHTGASDPPRERVLENDVALVGMRGRAFRHLVERFDPDFGFLQFQATDSVVHELPGDRAALARVYRAVDEELERTIGACEPDTVVLASDHGVGPYGGREVRVNEVLREAGYVETARGGGGMPTWASTRDRALVRGEADRPSPGALERATAALARAGITSQRVEAVLAPLGLAEPVARRVPTRGVSAATERVDFAASAAYVRSRVECGVRLNVAGREPDGVVAPEDYDAVRRDVIDLLAGLETPDGEPVFEDVAPREAYFEGPAAGNAVDVVTVPRAFDHMLSAQLRSDAFGEPREPWNHKREGVVALAGDGVDAGASLAGAHLFDVAPTVLATLGLPAGEHMDGAVLGPVEPAGTAAYDPVERRARGGRGARAAGGGRDGASAGRDGAGRAGRDDDRGDDDRDGTVEDRLADLGYLE